MANKITVLLDLVTDKAQASAKGFKSSIADAEGAANKFKAGASSAFATVKANAGALALGAGAALATFGAKSIAAFQDTALAAGKFSEATGLAVEDASRLQEVAGDLGVSTDAVAGTVVRLQKAVAANTDAVKELGIETKRTNDGQVDVLGTYLDAIDKLGGVEDANRRALLASQLFGKGFADSAELVLGSADQIKERLDGVASAQVITDRELERARKFRDQMDDLSDSLKQVEITVGSALVPVLGDLAEILVAIEENAGKAKSAIEDIPGGGSVLDALGTNLFELPKKSKQEWDELGRKIGIIPDKVDEIGTKRAEFEAIIAAGNEAKETFRDTADAAEETADEVADLGDKAANSGPKIGDMAGALDDARDHLAALNEEAKDNALEQVTEAIQGVRDAIDEAFGGLEEDLDLLDLFDNIQDQFERIAEAAKEANDPAGIRDFNREVRTLQEQLLDMVRTRDDLSAKEQIEFVARIRQGDIDELHRVLDDLTKDRFINVITRAAPQDAFASLNASLNPATGTATPIFNQPSGPTSSSIINQTIIYPVGSTPTTTYQNQQVDFRRNGIR